MMGWRVHTRRLVSVGRKHCASNHIQQREPRSTSIYTARLWHMRAEACRCCIPSFRPQDEPQCAILFVEGEVARGAMVWLRGGGAAVGASIMKSGRVCAGSSGRQVGSLPVQQLVSSEIRVIVSPLELLRSASIDKSAPTRMCPRFSFGHSFIFRGLIPSHPALLSAPTSAHTSSCGAQRFALLSLSSPRFITHATFPISLSPRSTDIPRCTTRQRMTTRRWQRCCWRRARTSTRRVMCANQAMGLRRGSAARCACRCAHARPAPSPSHSSCSMRCMCKGAASAEI